MRSEEENYIISLEKELHFSSVRQNELRLGELISNSFKEFGTSGKTYSKEDVLSHLPLETENIIESSNWEISQINVGAILVTYNTNRSIESTTVKAKRSSIWRKENNNWRLFFHQSSRI